MRFDDDEYLRRFYENREYPKIHDDIFSMSKYVDVDTVIDLGSCTGLLSHRLAQKYNVVGIEQSEKYVAKAIKAPNIKYVQLGITEDTLKSLESIIVSNGVKAIFARRVIPEIYETGGMSLVNKFVETIYRAGIEYVVLEGRKSNKNAVNPLHSIAEESRVFIEHYKCSKNYKNCKVLRRF